MTGATSPLEAWSGQFWEDERGIGYMSVHYEDKRLHKPPEGWVLIETVQDAEAETHVYRTNGAGGGTVPAVPEPESDQRTADL